MTGKIITVDFRNDTLFAVERADGVFVAVKPISDCLGLNWRRQLERLKDDPILSEGMSLVGLPSPGGSQETTCLKLELVNGWLFKIDSRRVKDEETRQKVLTYQRECYEVLFNHFYGKQKPDAVDFDLDDEQAMPVSTKVGMVREARHWSGNAAAGQLWFKLGLPVVPAMLEDPRQMTLLDYEDVKAADTA